MAMTILLSALSLPKPQSPALSSVRFFSNIEQLTVPVSPSIGMLEFKLSNLTIKMGGGPRTYPGGVSKWQWKRMQAKKAKQLLKARLCRERQIYEMRKRAELKAAISELERPWEVVEKAPNLFSVKADEQLKVLADRFQKPGGFDMWSGRDGPQILRPFDGLPSERFFPKGVVHSVKPYGVIGNATEPSGSDDSGGVDEYHFDDWIARGKGGIRHTRRYQHQTGKLLSDDEGIHETKGSKRNDVSGDSCLASNHSGISRDFEKRKYEGRKSHFDHSKKDIMRGRRSSSLNSKNSFKSVSINSVANRTKHGKVSGNNGDKYSDYNFISSYGRPRNNQERRYPSKSSSQSFVDKVTTERGGRVMINSNFQDNIIGDQSVTRRHFLDGKSSQRSDAHRKRMFNWTEDDKSGCTDQHM